jgi:hypothetical protein
MYFDDYLKRLSERIQALGSKPHKFFKYYINTPIVPDAMQELEQDFAAAINEPTLRISDSLKDFYQRADGFALSWVYAGQQQISPVVAGSTNISSILTIFNPGEITHQEFFGRFHVLDWIGEQNQVSLKFYPGHPEPELYYLADSQNHLMSIDFVTYMRVLSEVRALYPWQEFFIADKKFTRDPLQTSRFLENLRLLFPEVDPAQFLA